MWTALIPIIGVVLKGALEIWMAFRADSLRNRKIKEELKHEIEKAVASRDSSRLSLVIDRMRNS